ncbi:MAG: DUF6502 family protein [Steroidobacteraceae bacterium]
MTELRIEYLVEAFRKILRPLVKILIRSGVRYDEFCQILKSVYIDSAIRDGIGLPGEPTFSKISIATGIGRKDIDDFVANASRMPKPKPTIQAALSEILHLWHTDPTYLGPYGVPLEIAIAQTKGRNFVDLVKAVDSTIDPGILLEELVRSGAVVKSGESYLKVISRTFLVPEPMSPVMMEHFGNTVTNLTDTLEFNMDPRNLVKRLQRSVYADRGLTREQIAEFEKFAVGKAEEFMIDVDNWLADFNAKEKPSSGPVVDVGISVFQYIRPKQAEPTIDKVLATRGSSAV